jgi:hypothetical protein
LFNEWESSLGYIIYTIGTEVCAFKTGFEARLFNQDSNVFGKTWLGRRGFSQTIGLLPISNFIAMVNPIIYEVGSASTFILPIN